MTAAGAAEKSRKRAILLACILGSGIVFLDSTVVNVALPAIRDDLDAGLSTQQWVVEAYLLTLGSLLLIGGSLGDLFGRRRVFLLGVAAFGTTSLLCAVAPSGGALIAARALQGVAGALLVPCTMSVLVATFSEHERAAAIGSWTAWTGVSMVIGPLAGGVLIETASWRWVFAINVLPAAVALWLIARALPADTPTTPRPRIDTRGAALCSLGLAGIVFALIEQPRHGWGDPLIWGTLTAGAVLLALLVCVERAERDPMVPPEMFRRRNFTAGNLATFAIYAGLALVLFFLGLFLQQVAGYSPLQAGLSTLPITAVMLLLARRFGVLADRLGPRRFMTGGPVLAAVGLALLLRLDEGGDYLGVLLPGLVVFGIGLAATVAPLTAAVLGGVEAEHAGVASGINNATARIAGLIAVAAVGAAVAAQFSSSLDTRVAGRLDSAGRVALAQAKDRPLATEVPGTLPRAERALLHHAEVQASVGAFHLAAGLAALLVLCGGLISAAGVRDPRRTVPAADCPGGALVGEPEEAAAGRTREPVPAGVA